jgi:hypothetical protein
MGEDDPNDDAYVLPDLDAAAEELSSEGAAEYTLEMPARCPHCLALIRTLRVVRLARTKVTFTSPLPRGGRVLVCSRCERIISAELSGIL